MIEQEPLPTGTVRDQRITERVGQWGHGSGGKLDTSAERLQRLGEILGSGNPDALREWRISQLAMLLPGKTFPEPQQIDLSKIIR